MKKSRKKQMKVMNKYHNAGVEYGSMLGLCYMGKPFGYFLKKRKFLSLENKIAKLGYSPKNINYFIKKALFGGRDSEALYKGSGWNTIRDNKDKIKEYEEEMRTHSLKSKTVKFIKKVILN